MPPRRARLDTLTFDIGGTGLKASVLDRDGQMEVDPVRIETTYPMPPDRLVSELVTLAGQLPKFNRISAGFPGMVRRGKVLSAPHFVTKSGPGTKIVPQLVEAWRAFDLAAALSAALSQPAKVANDADLQGAAVVSGDGLELVVTLGTGVGTAVYFEGRLAPHLELAHHPFRDNETYNEQIGDAARKRIGAKRWNRRVEKAIEQLDALLFCDRIWIGGGNSKRITADLGPKVTLVDNTAGILGGIKLWARDTL